jgi:hypothetical protein
VEQALIWGQSWMAGNPETVPQRTDTGPG